MLFTDQMQGMLDFNDLDGSFQKSQFLKTCSQAVLQVLLEQLLDFRFCFLKVNDLALLLHVKSGKQTLCFNFAKFNFKLMTEICSRD